MNLWLQHTLDQEHAARGGGMPEVVNAEDKGAGGGMSEGEAGDLAPIR